MNKRIFTLMAAAMLLGAPMSNLTFAANPDAVEYSTIASSKKLANGVKFYLKETGGFADVEETEIDGTKYQTKTANNVADVNDAALFEIRNFSKTAAGITFELWVNGKKFAYDQSGKAKTLFTADQETIAFSNITVASVGSIGTAVFSSYKAYTKSETYNADDLNANLSGKGFSFQFPNAVSAPEKNPFANQMVAVDASDINAVWSAAPASGVYFAVANDAGKKLLDGVTADELKAATFVVLNPNSNFGITSLIADDGEGYDFTTIKGEDLKAANLKKEGEIAYNNAVYTVEEKDQLGALGQYTISMSNVRVKGDDNKNIATVNVGAYSLTGGGLKTYITTKSNTANLSLAQTTGNTWVKASDLLKADDAAIYNIYFMGTQPETPAEADASYYGKYLVATYATTTVPSAFGQAALAPAKVDLKSATAQWYISSVAEQGNVTFANLETTETFSCQLYKTDKAGIYETRGISHDGTEFVKLTPSTGINAFLTLADSQMKQGAELIFNGTGNVTVEKVYMSLVDENRPVTSDITDDKFIPSNDPDASFVWKFEKASSVKNKIEYAYFSDNEQKSKEIDTLAIQSYYLVYEKNGVKYGLKKATDYSLVKLNDGDVKADVWSQFAFKKNADGHYAMIEVVKAGAEYAYTDVVKAGIEGLYVDTSTSDFATAKIGDDSQYSHITVSFFNLGESLEATPRHATLDSEEGAISMKLNKGMLEGIIAAEGLTFWLDTADSKADMPTFYISKGIATEEAPETKAAEPAALRNFLYFAKDSSYYWNEDKANYVTDRNYYLVGTNDDVKAIFRPAALVGLDTIKTSINNNTVLVSKEAKEDVCLAGVENFKFYITKAGNGYRVVPSADQTKFLYNLNGKLGFTSDEASALVVTVGAGDPTSNDSIEAESSISVISGNGTITVQGAAGKKVVISNILGKVVAETVLTSDNATISVPAGIVAVAVDGEEAVKAVVK